jgi:hypothetical protein
MGLEKKAVAKTYQVRITRLTQKINNKIIEKNKIGRRKILSCLRGKLFLHNQKQIQCFLRIIHQ